MTHKITTRSKSKVSSLIATAKKLDASVTVTRKFWKYTIVVTPSTLFTSIGSFLK